MISPLRQSWYRLLTLMLAHFTIDLIGGLLPGCLPVVRRHFDLTLGNGVLLLAIMGIGSNLFQFPAGMMRRQATRPLMVPLGLALGSVIFLFALLPAGNSMALPLLCTFVVGVGIAWVHPEGLRGTMAPSEIPATLATSLFMVSGFLGFATGPLLGAVLVGRFGLPGLCLLAPLPVAVIVLLRVTGVRLAVDSGRTDDTRENAAGQPWSFTELFLIAVCLNTGSTAMQGLLPSFLNEKGFALPFCGMSAMLFGVGSAIGSILFGYLARRRRPSHFIMTAPALGLPVVLLYFWWSGSAAAAWLVVPAGLLLSAGFPLIVVLARNAPGRLSLSMRLATMVGGSWGIATALFLGIGRIADRTGLPAAMNFVWISYLAAVLIACAARARRKRRERR